MFLIEKVYEGITILNITCNISDIKYFIYAC